MSEDVWISAGVGAFVVLLFALALLVPRGPRGGRSTDVKLDDMKQRFDEIERKVERADHDIRNVRTTVDGLARSLATKDSVNGLALQVAEMRGEMKGLVTNTAATTRSIERIEDFLMKSTAEAIAATKGSDSKS